MFKPGDKVYYNEISGFYGHLAGIVADVGPAKILRTQYKDDSDDIYVRYTTYGYDLVDLLLPTEITNSPLWQLMCEDE